MLDSPTSFLIGAECDPVAGHRCLFGLRSLRIRDCTDGFPFDTNIAFTAFYPQNAARNALLIVIVCPNLLPSIVPTKMKEF